MDGIIGWKYESTDALCVNYDTCVNIGWDVQYIEPKFKNFTLVYCEVSTECMKWWIKNNMSTSLLGVHPISWVPSTHECLLSTYGHLLHRSTEIMTNWYRSCCLIIIFLLALLHTVYLKSYYTSVYHLSCSIMLRAEFNYIPFGAVAGKVIRISESNNMRYNMILIWRSNIIFANIFWR